MAPIFAYILHANGVLDDSAEELVTAAHQIDPGAQPIALIVGAGPDLDAACHAAAKLFQTVWKVDHKALAYPNAELIRKVLVDILPTACLVLVPHDHFGMDLAPGLSIKLEAAFVSDVVAIQGGGGSLLAVVRQEYGGQVSTHVTCDMASGAVMTLRPGSFPAAAAEAGRGAIIDKSEAVGELPSGRRFLKVVEAEAGDVDITKADILVSCGRGFEEQENLELAFELAEVLGAEVSCSRPVVDAKWLEKSRQVGTSGKTVKPKVYLACGISGSFQHMGGIKGNTFLVAINKNPRAPIFQSAQLGVVADVLEFLPKLTEKLKKG